MRKEKLSGPVITNHFGAALPLKGDRGRLLGGVQTEPLLPGKKSCEVSDVFNIKSRGYHGTAEGFPPRAHITWRSASRVCANRRLHIWNVLSQDVELRAYVS